MSRMRVVFDRVKALLRGDAIDHDMEREMAAHLEMLADEYEQAGMSRQEAVQAARRRFGNTLELRERGRDIRGAGLLGDLFRDLKYGWRNLRRTPIFMATVILTLAVGIGANTALFSLIDQLLLRPLPYPDGERLVMVYESFPELSTPQASASPANWLDWQRSNQSFESLAAWNEHAMTLTGQGEPERLAGQTVSAEFFPLLGVAPQLGRVFTREEDQPAAPGVVIISHRLWHARFGGDAQILGRHVELESNRYEIIGVMPPSFTFAQQQVDYWVPYALDRKRDWRNTGGRFIDVVGRIRAGITPAQAQSDMERVARSLSELHSYNRNTSVTVVSLRDALTGEVRPALLALFGAVGFLVLIACFNVASMLLARASSRKAELAIRSSLGASRWIVVRQLMIESLLLAVLGGLAGVFVGQASLHALLALIPENLVSMVDAPLDTRILIYTAALSICAGCLFGVAPAFSVTRNICSEGWKGLGRRFTHTGRLRHGLVVMQVALTVVLLCGAGLFIRSLLEIAGARTGVDARNVVTMYLQPDARYSGAQRIQFFNQVLEKLSTLSTVESLAAGSTMPVVGGGAQTVAHVKGTPALFRSQDLERGLRISDLQSMEVSAVGGIVPFIRVVSPGYFKTLGIPVLRGRDFSPDDQRPNSQPVFIVNETLASRYLAGGDPLNTSLSVLMAGENPYGRIIGVVGDVIQGSLRSGAEPTVFYVLADGSEGFYLGMTVFIRSRDAGVVRSAVQTVRDVDNAQAVTQIRMLEDILSDSASRERLTAILSAAFAVTALFLAVLGIYGLLAYSVAERTQEIGIRIAMGGKPQAVFQSVMMRGLGLVVAGLALGLAGALVMSRFIQTLLFGVTAYDPVAFGATLAVLLLAGGLAAFIPARRAASVDPMVALRQE